MGLTVLIFVTLLAAEPKNSLAADLNGIWVADLAVCNFRALPRPNKLFLRVSRYHNQLEVTEVHSDGVGKIRCPAEVLVPVETPRFGA